MKYLSKAIMLGVILTFNSCGNTSKKSEVNESVENNNSTKESRKYTILPKESIINWLGKGVGHSNEGTINVSSGSFSIDNEVISNFEITVDMNSILITNIEDSSEKKKLSNHFKNNDFFGVDEFPNSTLKIIDATDVNSVRANMTIKGVTQEISFPVAITKQNDKLVLKTKLQIDRTKFGITYNSGNFFKNLGDYLIDDMFELEITIVSN